MAVSQAMCTSFKLELLSGVHDFSTDTFKLALYSSLATLNADTTAYTTTNETTGGGYTAGGKVATVASVANTAGAAYVDFSDVAWTSATFSARAALLYNSSKGDRAIAVLDFGESKSVSGGNLTVQFPPAGADTAVVRII